MFLELLTPAGLASDIVGFSLLLYGTWKALLRDGTSHDYTEFTTKYQKLQSRLAKREKKIKEQADRRNSEINNQKKRAQEEAVQHLVTGKETTIAEEYNRAVMVLFSGDVFLMELDDEDKQDEEKKTLNMTKSLHKVIYDQQQGFLLLLDPKVHFQEQRTILFIGATLVVLGFVLQFFGALLVR